MPVLSMLALTTTQRRLPLNRSGGGGIRPERNCILTKQNYSLPQTEADQTERETNYGKKNCNDFQPKPDYLSLSITFHRQRANGIKLNIDYFPIFLSIGEQSH